MLVHEFFKYQSTFEIFFQQVMKEIGPRNNIKSYDMYLKIFFSTPILKEELHPTIEKWD